MGISPGKKWTQDDSCDLYNIDRWGCGYFEIDEAGFLNAKSQAFSGNDFKILDAVEFARRQGFNAPFIVRFPDIIHDRIRQIHSSFAAAISEFEYGGHYGCFFPAKVNQHHEVVASVIEAVKEHGGGVEAGTKAELLAMLLMTDNSVPILCNGYKDKTIIELAFRAMQLGRAITIIIEKPNEVDVIAKFADQFGICPTLGVRVKLAARSGGRWNASGGSKSKFGLTIPQLQQVVAQIREFGLVQHLQLLHFHPGSQVSNIRKIKNSLTEATRIYAELYQAEVPLKTIDVGGGLAVDYTGSRTNSPSSRNYSLQEYANDVVYYIQQVCAQASVPEPDIISESGRWVSAHHSMIVIPVIDSVSGIENDATIDTTICDSVPFLAEMKEIYESDQLENLSECFHDTQVAIENVWQMFSHGTLSLEQRTSAEQMAANIYRRIAGKLDDLEFVPPELDELRHYLAETYVANFSLFQALPDSWALDQLFPIVPLHRLTERPTVRAVIGDITCDSDGTISCFVGSSNAGKSLPLHELTTEPYYLGIFLIGAYQEALSDDHNLLGDFHVLNVARDGEVTIRQGATTMDVLAHVHHAPETILQTIEQCMSCSPNLPDQTREEICRMLQSVVHSYTYLSPNSVPRARFLSKSTSKETAASQT